MLASAAADASASIEELAISGNRRTRSTTFEALLPRPLPTALGDPEIDELERRIRNLGIFDAVTVARRGHQLDVTVREKWTLIPSLEFSSGRSAIDTNVLVGVTEANIFGTGHHLSVAGGFVDRGPQLGLAFEQHGYGRGTWAHAFEIGYESSELRFGADLEETDEDAPEISAWQRHRVGAGYFASPDASYERQLRFGAGPFLAHEWLAQKRVGTAGEPLGQPRGATWAGLTTAFWIDELTFDDLVPAGAAASLEISPIFRLGQPGQGERGAVRGEAHLDGDLAAGFAGFLGFLAHGAASVVTAGDPNHSLLLGSQRGVRGLDDNLYRNRAQAHVNLELRAAWRLAARWALQGVGFTDAAVFQPLGDQGEVRPTAGAWSTGAGVRLIPTWLAGLLVRVDVARLWAPTPRWFVQLGAAQYF